MLNACRDRRCAHHAGHTCVALQVMGSVRIDQLRVREARLGLDGRTPPSPLASPTAANRCRAVCRAGHNEDCLQPAETCQNPTPGLPEFDYCRPAAGC
jgi:hypothetical protein